MTCINKSAAVVAWIIIGTSSALSAVFACHACKAAKQSNECPYTWADNTDDWQMRFNDTSLAD